MNGMPHDLKPKVIVYPDRLHATELNIFAPYPVMERAKTYFDWLGGSNYGHLHDINTCVSGNKSNPAYALRVYNGIDLTLAATPVIIALYWASLDTDSHQNHWQTSWETHAEEADRLVEIDPLLRLCLRYNGAHVFFDKLIKSEASHLLLELIKTTPDVNVETGYISSNIEMIDKDYNSVSNDKTIDPAKFEEIQRLWSAQHQDFDTALKYRDKIITTQRAINEIYLDFIDPHYPDQSTPMYTRWYTAMDHISTLISTLVKIRPFPESAPVMAKYYRFHQLVTPDQITL